MTDVDEHDGGDDHVERAPPGPGNNDQDTLGVRSEPQVVLDNEGFEGTSTNERECF